MSKGIQSDKEVGAHEEMNHEEMNHEEMNHEEMNHEDHK